MTKENEPVKPTDVSFIEKVLHETTQRPPPACGLRQSKKKQCEIEMLTESFEMKEPYRRPIGTRDGSPGKCNCGKSLFLSEPVCRCRFHLCVELILILILTAEG
jgi:hypothetical protein